MKKVLSLLNFLLFAVFTVSAQQTVVFHETFELPSLADSVTSSQAVVGVNDWAISTKLYSQGLRSDTCQVKSGKVCYLTTNTFSTLGNTAIILQFSQICKVDFSDKAQIQVSADGGLTWALVTQANYMGTGAFGTNGQSFSSNSYGTLWQPATGSAIPTNSWWKTEQFDLSLAIPNTATAKIRFKLSDGGTPGPNSNYGWCIDDIKVLAAPCELIPPTITPAPPIFQGTLFSLGPFPIKAYIHDASLIDTAYLVYTVNAGPSLTLGMHHIATDTMMATIPAVLDSTTVCWHIWADDNSPCHNVQVNPSPGCYSFLARGGITFPFCDNFDGPTSWWTASQNTPGQGSNWQLGTPSYSTVTNNSHSPPNCWDVDLSSQYLPNSYCILTSPIFDFSQAIGARLSFWINYWTEASWDGVRVEYTKNGTTWLLLGTYPPDPLVSTNWYNNSNLSSSSEPGWAGTSPGWVQCKYKLSMFDNNIGQARLRFIFTSDGIVQYDGFSIDDFCITLPAPKEASLKRIIMPVTGCGLGMDTVRIKIANEGLTPMNGTNCTASYRVKNNTTGIWSNTFTENVPNVIVTADSSTFTFTQLANLTATNADIQYTIKAWVSLQNDPNHGDDTLFSTITSKFIPPPPVVTNPSILYGAFANLTATTGSGNTVNWYTVPCTGAILATGTTYQTPFLYAQTVYYLNATNTNGCVSICQSDTVHVGAPPPYDGSAISWISPNSGIDLTAAEIVKITITNFGTQAISHFPVRYTKGTVVVTDTCQVLIASGATTTFTFAQPVDLSLYQTYPMKAWVDVPGDINHINDTIKKNVTNSMLVYCNSTALNPADDDIGNVTISNINNGNPNPSTNNPSSVNLYTDFTQSVPPIFMAKGQTYPISISQINSNGYYNCYCKVFVDWNYDGVFDQATETAFDHASTGAAGIPFTGSINVPVNAHTGYTRFRVTLQESGSQLSVTPCNSYSWGETEDYTAMVLPQIPHDAGVTAISVPPAVYPQNYNAQPAFTVKNFGSDTIFSSSGFTYNYKLDNGIPQTTPYLGIPIPSGSTLNVTFPAITWPVGTHYFKAWTHLPGDTNTFNDTLRRTITGVPVDTIPYYDNFDGITKFTNSGTGGTNWILGAPAGANFPGTVVSPPSVWATNLNVPGGYTNNANCTLTSQIFDFTTAVNAKLHFSYKYNTESGNDGVTLKYSTDAGATWQNLGVINDGNASPAGSWFNSNIWTQSNAPGWSGVGSSNWVSTTYKLNTFNGTPTLRFQWTFTSNASAVNNGMAIDNFSISIPWHKDAGIDSIKLPNAAVLDAGITYYPKLRIKNYGMDTLFSVPITYQIDNNAPISWIQTLPATGLKPDDTISITAPLGSGYVVPQGTYLMTAYTNLVNDGDLHNDTCRSLLFGVPIFNVPFTDNFDTIHRLWYATGTQWQFGTPALTNTIINHPYSPPYCWKTILNGNYQRTGIVEYLYSPKFDFSGTGWDSLKFYHWVHIYQNDGGKVEYLASNGNWKTIGMMGDPNAVNWYNNGSYGFNNQGGLGGWHQSMYDLKVINDFAIPTQFRFAFSALYINTTWNGWAIDNFELTSPKIQFDGGVIAINSPIGTTTYGQPIQVNVTIQNFGWDTLTYIPVKYRINGITVGAGTWTGTLLPGATTTFQFVSMPSPLAIYKLCAYTDIPNDTHYTNDTTCTDIIVVPPPIDLGVTHIIQPVVQTIHGLPATVTIEVTNFGQDTVSVIPVVYTVAGNGIVVAETWYRSSPLQHGEIDQYTFNHTYSYSFIGWYNLCAYTAVPNDGYATNDTFCLKIEEKYTGIDEIDPNGLALWQNSPNPSDRTTEILYHLPKPGEFEFNLVNFLGQKMISRTEKATEGDHQLVLNTTALPSGIYYYYIRFDGRQLVRKMLISH